MQTLLWSEKYRPKRVSEVVGNEGAKAAFLRWLKEWKPTSKAALMYGPPGTGKTTLVHVAAAELGYTFVEMNASDMRTETAIMSIAGPASREASLESALYGGRGSLIFMDEVDGIFGNEDRGGLGALNELIQKSRIPIVLAANNPWNPHLQSLRRVCEMIRFYHIRTTAIIALLRRICSAEGIQAEGEALRLIAGMSKGDIRSAVNDLQSVVEGRKTLNVDDVKPLAERDRKTDIFDTLRAIFSSTSGREARAAVNESELDYDLLLLSLSDNLPLQFLDHESLAAGYDALSKADVFLGRVKRTQNWGLLSYVMDEMAWGMASVARGRLRPARYQFPPTKLILLNQNRATRDLLEEIGSLIGEKCHVSRRVAQEQFIPFLRVIFKNEPQTASRLAQWLSLDEEMIKFLKG